MEPGEIPGAQVFACELGLILANTLLDFCTPVSTPIPVNFTRAADTRKRLSNTGFAALIRVAGYGWTVPELCRPEGVRHLWLVINYIIHVGLVPCQAGCGTVVPALPEKVPCCTCHGIGGLKTFTPNQFPYDEWANALAALRVALVENDLTSRVEPPEGAR